MSTQQQFLDAVTDFEGLIREGKEASVAASEAAAANGIDCAVFVSRLTREVSLEDRAETIRHDAEYGRFLAAARSVVEFCDKDFFAFAGKNALDMESKIINVAVHVQQQLGRPLSEHEVWKIGELLDPIGTQLRMNPNDRTRIKELFEREFGGDR